ncbi:Mitotic-spindle organizing protein 2 [Bulinus truncatus]|nr:Mitotic-spindle organizing protein 2 [Bulinus truncatus]
MKMSKLQKKVIHAQLVSKAVLSPDENELFLFSQYAGITMDPQVFKIILDLLRFNVPPLAIVDTLKSMCTPNQLSSSALLGSGEPHHSHIHSSFTSHDSSSSQLSASRSISGERHVRGSSSSFKSFGSDHHSQSISDDASSYTFNNSTKESSHGNYRVSSSHVDRPDLHHITIQQRGSVDDSRVQNSKERSNKKR